ncbi:MAG: YkgJ family cysteine cluster protein [Deltaproteobacteria bacterium]|nr:YkgJ family cysteine cluster protein [Deltaproteobacteria bacterium]
MSELERRDKNQIDRTIVDTPAKWDRDALRANLLERLVFLASEQELELSEKRVRFQIEQDQSCRELIESWSRSDDTQRIAIWKKLLRRGLESLQDLAKTCVRCGQCCRKSSPTLYLQDLELVRSEKIPLSNLVTLRKGEPVTSPFSQTPFYLPEECIKLREKPGATECIFLDSATDLCLIYQSRPYQCQVQTCWDASGIKELTSQTMLTRNTLFAGLDTLVEIMNDHENRCHFEMLYELFETLKETQGESVEELLDALAFEDHYRNFIAEKLNLPRDSLELFFGRSFSKLARLFGYRVEDRPDGSHVLLPDESLARPSES